MPASSMDSLPSFSRRTSSSLLSSSISCSRCCSTKTRRRRRSRSRRAMLPACLDSLIFRMKSPASCSSSCLLGSRDCRASTRSLPVAAFVVCAKSLSGCRSSSSSSSELSWSGMPFRVRASNFFDSPRVARPVSKSLTPRWTSVEAKSRLRSSFSCCMWKVRLLNRTSAASLERRTCMLSCHRSADRAFHSSFAPLFCLRRSLRLKRWISLCSAMWACSMLSISKATSSCLCISISYFFVTLSILACFTFRPVARRRCSKKRRSWPSN
mmetsp:Transcript_1260/g.2210  ORF Transcript_1260/g.2210 Transcript_1260/m.2210 type:complete len:268 (-) Transcript_1260:518-1321(-)